MKIHGKPFSEKFDKLLDEILETGLFALKADILRFAAIAYLKDLGFIGNKNMKKNGGR